MNTGLEFTADWSGVRLDQLLAKSMPGRSRSDLQNLIRAGQVAVDGVAAAKPGRRLRAGERVKVAFLDNSWTASFDFEDQIIHEDENILVVNKPPGLVMHPSGKSWMAHPRAALDEPQPNFAGLMAAHRPRAAAAAPRCGIVHRLDRETSGIFVAAKTAQSWKRLCEAFASRSVSKTYRAVVRGAIKDKSIDIEAPVGRTGGRWKIKVTPYGRHSKTVFRVIERLGKMSLVEATPLTGRTHQIRAHLAFIGHPVAGDPDFDRDIGERLRAPRLMLHAYSIAFPNPKTGAMMRFRKLPPSDFYDFWRACREAERKR
ncbi:MAG: RluA family pseudouridine synthase [Elusimicrobiota bacterium]